MAVSFSISELRVLAEQLTERLQLPFKHMTHSFFKRRLAQYFEMNSIRKTDQLFDILEGESRSDEFCHFFTVTTTELFRDAGFWRHLRKIINESYANKRFNIWLPDGASGEELYSLLILLDESSSLKNASITVNLSSNKGIEDIKMGLLSAKKMDVNAYNYKRFEGSCVFEDYFNETPEGCCLNATLLSNVKLQKGNFDHIPDEKCDIIIMRNCMLYYAKDFHQDVKIALDKALVSGGYLCLGVKEQLAIPYDDRFECIDSKEKIYNKFKFLRD